MSGSKARRVKKKREESCWWYFQLHSLHHFIERTVPASPKSLYIRCTDTRHYNSSFNAPS